MKDYKKILEGVVNIINTTEKSDIGFANICSYICENCPELKESEDERIRKEILEYLNQFENGELRGVDITPWIAWLEKQGEQKSIISDDALREGKDYFGITQHQIDNWLKKYVHVEKQGEQKPAAWNEQDEKLIKNLISTLSNLYARNLIEKETKEKYTNLLNSLKNRVQLQHEWKQENTGDLTDFENAMMHIGNSFFGQYAGLDPNDTNAIKEQANALLGLVPSKEWSEEDERLRQSCIKHIEEELERIRNDKYGHSEIISDLKESCRERIKWLESLKPQKRWKPSDEQMRVLDLAIRCGINRGTTEETTLVSLFNDLKKLK